MITGSAFDRLVQMVEQSGVPFVLHEHQAMKTMADAEQYLSGGLVGSFSR